MCFRLVQNFLAISKFLDSMKIVDDVEDLLKNETNFQALVRFHLLKVTITEKQNSDHF